MIVLYIRDLFDVLMLESGVHKTRTMAGYGGETPQGSNRGRTTSSMPDGVIEENVILFAVPKKGRTARARTFAASCAEMLRSNCLLLRIHEDAQALASPERNQHLFFSHRQVALGQVMKILKGAGFDAKRPDRLDVAMCRDLPIKLVPP